MATIQSELEGATEFEQLLEDGDLRTLFQPIVAFGQGGPDIYAVEALTRGPTDGPFESAKALFNAATQHNKIYQLEQIARELAIKRFESLDHGNLFINLDPNIIYDDSFTPGNTLSYLRDQNLNREHIVFEITERNKIKNRDAFEEAVRHYRQQGFRMAVDDVGAGYSNLDKIANLKPDFIKIDMSLIRDVHLNRQNSKLVETIIDFADRIGSEVVAEGIENAEELQTLLSMGIDYAQGFFLSRPSPDPDPVNDSVQTIYERCSETGTNRDDQPKMGELAKSVETFDPDTLTRDVYRYLDENPEERSVVLVRDGKPVGLLMRNHLHEQLSTNMGQSLYWKRPVRKVMEDDPLVVPLDTPVGDASELVTDRNDESFYNEVIVVERETGQYRGNVNIKQLLEKITQLKTRKARRANPLTGLPGNVEIRDRIQRNLNHDRDFALIYADLDHFKPFNDYYGFERGDQAILLLKNVLSDGLSVHPDGNNFLGHIGGDDFVVIASAENARDFCEYVIDQFDDRIRELYDPEDLEEGFIRTTNRQQETVRFNIMTVSLAVVTNQGRDFDSNLEMSEVAAEVKKYCKRDRNNSTYEVDRRS